MTAREVERAVTGDLADNGTQSAIGKLWKVFLAHAHDVGGKKDTAVRANVDEAPKRREPQATRDETRTLYAGREQSDKSKGTGREAALGTEVESRECEGLSVSAGGVRRRVRSQLALEAEGNGHYCVPQSNPHRNVRWDTESAHPDLWQHASGAGFTEVTQEELQSDPVMRMLLRLDDFE